MTGLTQSLPPLHVLELRKPGFHVCPSWDAFCTQNAAVLCFLLQHGNESCESEVDVKTRRSLKDYID